MAPSTRHQADLQWRFCTWRHWKRTPWRSALLIGILALGVAVFFSIRLANRAALAGFQLFSENITGSSDLVISSPAGKLPTKALPAIRTALDDLPAGLFPVLESTATQPTGSAGSLTATSYHLVGVDLAALPNLLYLTREGEASNFLDARQREPAEPDAHTEIDDLPGIFPSASLAQKEGWERGDVVDLIIDDTIQRLRVDQALPSSSFQVEQPDNLLVMDLPQLQALTDQVGTIHRVEVRFPAGHWSEEWQQEAKARLRQAGAESGQWLVETPEQQRQAGSTMTQAFRLNLSILSCLALVVGVYLILQALEAAVVRRRPEIATLRSLGVSPKSIRWAWQGEALLMGILGTAVGLLLGWGLAQGTVRGIAQTVNALYFSNTTRAAAWHWGEAGLATLLGLTASALAGWLPARDAATTPPAHMLRRGTRSDGLRSLLSPRLGLGLIALAVAAHLAPPWITSDGSRLPLAGFAAAFFWVSGAGVLASLLFPAVAALMRLGTERAPQRFYASRQLRHATGRHRLAAAGLVVAVAMAGGMSILVGSFENTVVRWLDQVMRADLYVACQGASQASSQNRLQPDTWSALVNDPRVARAEFGQAHRIRFRSQPVTLAGIEHRGSEPQAFQPIWLQAPARASFPNASAVTPLGGEPVNAVMSEPFTHRFDCEVGDVIEVPTPQGAAKLRLVGVFADYGDEFGRLLVSRQQLSHWFDDERVARLSITVADEVPLDQIQSEWMQRYPGIVVTNRRQLRQEALRIFHQTFAVTHALKWIGVLVALAGLAMALSSMLLERQKEQYTLRALGLDPRAVGRSTAWESIGIATNGLLVGGLLSLVLGQLIIYVINRQSFGWTLLYKVPALDFAILAGGVLLVSGWIGYALGKRTT